MNLPFKIARRYLFAKKSTNAINIISSISVFGIAVGTAALILVLSVFNGFEELITGLFSNFNPDVKIIPAKGKTFKKDTLVLRKLEALEGVAYVSGTLEETALFEYRNSQDFGIVKGVDDNYEQVTGIDSMMVEGAMRFKDGERFLAVLGLGMRNKLSVNIDDFMATLNVYMPKRKTGGPLSKPFRKKHAYPAGTFVIQQDVDQQYVLTSIDFVSKLLNVKGKYSALEIKLNSEVDHAQTLAAIGDIMGDNFVVKDRYRQDEAFLKLMNIEKWMSFAILSLTLILVAFNMIGALWMIVLEKKNDISILKSMGATDPMVRSIFLNEGLLLGLVGLILGFAIALILYFSQKNWGIVPIPEGFVVNAYPISMRFVDFVIVAVTVICIALLASIPPALRAARVPALIRGE